MRPAARDLVVATAFYLGGEQPRLVIVPAGGVAGDIPGVGLQRRAPAAAMVEGVNLHHRPLPRVTAHGVRAGRPIPRMAQHRGAPVQHARQVRRLRFAAPPWRAHADFAHAEHLQRAMLAGLPEDMRQRPRGQRKRRRKADKRR